MATRPHIPKWQPGRTLSYPRPTLSPVQSETRMPSSHEPFAEVSSLAQIHRMLQLMQNSIVNNIESMKGRLAELEDRMASMEEKHKELASKPDIPASSSTESPTEFCCKRRQPPELQVRIPCVLCVVRVC